MTDRNELERLHPMTTEQKALALVNEALVESGWECFSLAIAQTRYDCCFDTLCRSIEAHETDKKAFSDAVAGWVKADRKGADARRRASEHLVTFIIPDPEPDPLVEEIKKAAALIGQSITDVQAANITFYFAARGYKIERIEQ